MTWGKDPADRMELPALQHMVRGLNAGPETVPDLYRASRKNREHSGCVLHVCDFKNEGQGGHT